MNKRPVNQMSPPLQFLVFVAVFTGVFIICNLIGAGLVIAIYGLNMVMDVANLNFSNPQSIQAIYLLQIITTTIPVFLAPVIFSYLVVKSPDEYLKPGFRFPWMLMIVAFFVMMVSSPLIEWLSNINQQMVLPQWLSGIERWMKASEESARRLVTALLRMSTIWDAVKNVFLVGFLTAVAEEFMFRGGLQTIMVKWTKNTHAAIWIAAAIFSAFHMEFYGFLPRMLLGGLFGYFVAWSGSIWPAVWSHFLNNGTAVVATYLYQKKLIKLNPDNEHIFSSPGYLFSLIIIIILLLVYKKIAAGRLGSTSNGEELG